MPPRRGQLDLIRAHPTTTWPSPPIGRCDNSRWLAGPSHRPPLISAGRQWTQVCTCTIQNGPSPAHAHAHAQHCYTDGAPALPWPNSESEVGSRRELLCACSSCRLQQRKARRNGLWEVYTTELPKRLVSNLRQHQRSTVEPVLNSFVSVQFVQTKLRTT